MHRPRRRPPARGQMVGALLDKVLPEWLITIMLFVLLFYTS